MSLTNNSQNSALDIHQLMVNYGKTSVLWDISMTIPQGVLVGVIGPNGAGKSTFIKASLDIVKPASGNVQFFGKKLKHVRQRVAYIPQRETVDWDFPVTVRDLVVMGRYGRLGLFSQPTQKDWAAVNHYLNLVGMEKYAHRQISQLSGGQQQRAFLARALLQEADVYFMDEPFTGIDIGTEAVIIQLLKQLRNQGKTLFVVHHDLNTVKDYFDWVILLNLRLVGYGPTETFFTPDHLNSTYGKSYAFLKNYQEEAKAKKDVIESPFLFY